MFLQQFSGCARFNRFANGQNIRMMSTVIGGSGRSYVMRQVLSYGGHDQIPIIFKAESQHESFIVKRVPRTFYDLSLRLAAEFASSRRLRMHIDCNLEESVLIYPYYRSTLLSLIQDDDSEDSLPITERKKILRGTGEAIQELHTRGWIHCDVKPDNVLVNWTCNAQGVKSVIDVALGDFDIAYKLQGELQRQTPHAIGNAMWRSPEGQTGISSKASDVFSFGLVCLYVLGAGDLLLIKDYREVTKSGHTAEQEILTRHFSYFGPAPKELFEQISDEHWRHALAGASAIAENEVKQQPGLRSVHWTAELGHEAQDMLSGMTDLNPTSRVPIEKVVKHRWLQETT
ncbi:hypothetical protein CLIM01_13943 [Colletotrichum limetticola]|uniref:Protein kinase domain-containing protein n=1 Tax=Colletotrichum limetticola TaxID=1209924 RepID=A0ABQ9PD04_9PEZI|nr:hypothetical protein CLIM01_13943 [Colletotrichum limetticola]